MVLDILILNDIGEINALILRIEKEVDWIEIRRSYKDKVISIWNNINWKYHEKERHQFNDLLHIRMYLMWILRWIRFNS